MTNLNNISSKNLIQLKIESLKGKQEPQAPAQTTQVKSESDLISRYLEGQARINRPAVDSTSGINDIGSAPVNYKNNMRQMFKDNNVVMIAIVPRIFTAKDLNGDDKITKAAGEKPGTFLSAISRLDELKRDGFNAIHLLPIHPPGKTNAMGTAGSLYAPEKFITDDGKHLAIDPVLIDKNDPRTPDEQFKAFINECHKRDIKVMLDLPSCCSVDMFNAHPEMMAVGRNNEAKVPEGWTDIRMFSPWEDESKRILNKPLLDMHKKYVDACIDLGIDGIRSDVARAKPTEFWDILIPYSHSKDPEFAWLGEAYTYECASPQQNMPYDRPEDSLRAGFDSIYGQYHIFHEMKDAKEVKDYVIQNLDMSHRLPVGKSLIGSFTTHDDESLMMRGGENFCNMVSVVQATLPMVNPYFLDGFQTGDKYEYQYGNKIVKDCDTVTMTQGENPKPKHFMEVHKNKMDIFNLSRQPGGDSPEIRNIMTSALESRKSLSNLMQKGSFIDLAKRKDNDDQVLAFARHLDGKTALVVVNLNKNRRSAAEIEVPGIKESQEMKNLVKNYGEKSYIQVENNKVKVDLGPSRAHVYMIDTPNIENDRKGHVYVQNFTKNIDPKNPPSEPDKGVHLSLKQ